MKHGEHEKILNKKEILSSKFKAKPIKFQKTSPKFQTLR